MYMKSVPFFRKIRNSIYERRSEQQSFPYPCHTLMLHPPVIFNYFCSKRSARILVSKKIILDVKPSTLTIYGKIQTHGTYE